MGCGPKIKKTKQNKKAPTQERTKKASSSCSLWGWPENQVSDTQAEQEVPCMEGQSSRWAELSQNLHRKSSGPGLEEQVGCQRLGEVHRPQKGHAQSRESPVSWQDSIWQAAGTDRNTKGPGGRCCSRSESKLKERGEETGARPRAQLRKPAFLSQEDCPTRGSGVSFGRGPC